MDAAIAPTTAYWIPFPTMTSTASSRSSADSPDLAVLIESLVQRSFGSNALPRFVQFHQEPAMLEIRIQTLLRAEPLRSLDQRLLGFFGDPRFHGLKCSGA